MSDKITDCSQCSGYISKRKEVPLAFTREMLIIGECEHGHRDHYIKPMTETDKKNFPGVLA